MHMKKITADYSAIFHIRKKKKLALEDSHTNSQALRILHSTNCTY